MSREHTSKVEDYTKLETMHETFLGQLKQTDSLNNLQKETFKKQARVT
jgi:hypothetical protein